MAPRTRSAARLTKGPATPEHAFGTQVAIDANTRGFPALADEIYLEIISHIQSVPIPTLIHLPSYPEIRRSRHETLLSLSQTCRSLRRFFWHYLWQRIEVREGMKVGGENDTLSYPTFNNSSANKKLIQKYTVGLARQLEMVTVRNPQLAQHVEYLDIFIGEYSFDTVLAELARCLSQLSNLHTIQISAALRSNQALKRIRSFERVFEQTFKKYSYPQIRNVFVTPLSASFLASCPEARRVGFMEYWLMSSLQAAIDNCPCVEVFEDLNGMIGRNDDISKFVVDSFPNLRHITITFPVYNYIHADPPPRGNIDVLAKLDQLQAITVLIQPLPLTLNRDDWHEDRELKRDWLEKAKKVLITVQLRDKLEKFLTIITIDPKVYNQVTQTITLKPFEDLRMVL